MTKPHETLGLPQPVGRQIAQHTSVAWYVLIWLLIFGMTLTYVGFITTSSARGFQLRDAEQRLERLQSEARALEMEVAKVSSIGAMATRAQDLGFVVVNRVETVNAAGHSYAYAR
ncbi:hypothetical protein GF380_04125 [Candidatus Uhrbacteria bacterium]|nr:hypothetical protein [Candidatus Uhrbacteria bacterium]MBD3284271.1 hypothetical protein [Candidatus Uhrbacteria bacterium]